ncbi:hypothetical protein CRG98_023160 [Punica granatum]|uniref:Uncharacterized protein n=1 Tax=Punica granatum TaxID=22663 RepID=A0A2I0JJI7_PUNGR|nr:hypothetical protein CRG98_023160 [Punica granatum]
MQSHIRKIEGEGIGAANRQPRTLHRGHCPQRTSETSVEGLGSPIGGPDPESTGDFGLKSPIDSGSGLPIGNPDSSTEVAGTLGGGVGVADWWPRPPPLRSFFI